MSSELIKRLRHADTPMAMPRDLEQLTDEAADRIEQQAARIAEFERILDGLPQEAIDGGWTARGISAYAKKLEGSIAYLEDLNRRVIETADSIDAKRKADAKDVERYRWLRDWRADASDFCCASLEIYLPVPARDEAAPPRKHSECFDAAIDAAIKSGSGS